MVDMRYQGQAYELTIPLTPPAEFGEREKERPQGLIQRFHETHARTYGHALPERPVEVVNVRLQAVGRVEKPVLEQEPVPDGTPPAAHNALLGHKSSLNGATMALYDRESLLPGACFDGAALVFQLDSTVYVAPGWSARVDGWRNLVLERRR